MAIGFDSDDTLFYHNQQFAEWIHHNKLPGFTIDKFKNYRLWEAWNGKQEEAITFIKEFYDSEQGYLNKPVQGIQQLINHYKARGEQLYVISARSIQQEKVIKAINEVFPNTFEDIIFGGHFLEHKNEQTKATIAQQLNITTFFEDAYHHAKDLANNNIETYLINRKWNMNGSEEHPLIHRVNSWKKAYEKIIKK